MAEWMRQQPETDRESTGAVQVAALPWRRTADGELQILIVTSRGTGRWIIPKGWPHKGLSLAQSAAREALEEAGVKGAVEDRPIGNFLYDKVRENGDSVPVRVAVFPLKVTKQSKSWREKGQRRLHWVTPAQAADLLDDAELKTLVRRFDRPPGRSGAFRRLSNQEPAQ